MKFISKTETIMKERTISKREMLTLLRRMQKFQLEDMGNRYFEISTLLDEEGPWFTVTARIGKKYLNAACYGFRTYEENRQLLDDFVKEIQDYDNQKEKEGEQ